MTYLPEPIKVPEGIIDREITWSVQCKKKGDGSLWASAYFAWRVVRLYQAPAIETLAHLMGVERTQVENYIFAIDLYFSLRTHGLESEVNRIRKTLTLTHFIRAAERQRKWNMSNADVMRYLRDYRDFAESDQPASAANLAQSIDTDYDRSGKVATFAGYWLPRLRTWYAGALVAEDTPETVSAWLKQAPKEVTQ